MMPWRKCPAANESEKHHIGAKKAEVMNGKLDGGREGAPPSGQVRVLVLGDAGVGKSSLVHLIVNERPINSPRRTVGCAVDVKHLVYKEPSSGPFAGKTQDRDFFVELWDISGHEQYEKCRSLFYAQINGVIFVHDLSQRKTKASLQKWATEVASLGTFSAPLPARVAGALPVPLLVVGNKADIAPKPGAAGSSSNLVDAARQWVEKQGLLSPTDELPVTESFPGGQGLVSTAKEGRLDMEAVKKYFFSLIRRRYYGEEVLPMPYPIPYTSPPPNLSRGLPSYHTRRASHGDADSFSESSYIESNSSYIIPRSRQLRLSPPTSPLPEQPLSQADFHPLRLGPPISAMPHSSERTSRLDLHL